MPFCGNLEDVDRFINKEQTKRSETSTKEHSIGAYFGAPGIGKSRLLVKTAMSHNERKKKTAVLTLNN